MPFQLLIRPDVRTLLPSDFAPALRRRAARMVRAAALKDELLPVAEVEVTLVLTGDDEIHELNRQYRNKDQPTDVLAFAAQEGAGAQYTPLLLGDVVVSVETAQRQADNRDLVAEIEFLWAHGLCHLLGYDHQSDEEESVMNARVESLLRQARGKGRTAPA